LIVLHPPDWCKPPDRVLLRASTTLLQDAVGADVALLTRIVSFPKTHAIRVGITVLLSIREWLYGDSHRFTQIPDCESRSMHQSLGTQPGQKIQVIQYENHIELIPVRPVAEIRGFLKGIERR
jgi:hypothetical protein